MLRHTDQGIECDPTRAQTLGMAYVAWEIERAILHAPFLLRMSLYPSTDWRPSVHSFQQIEHRTESAQTYCTTTENFLTASPG